MQERGSRPHSVELVSVWNFIKRHFDRSTLFSCGLNFWIHRIVTGNVEFLPAFSKHCRRRIDSDYNISLFHKLVGISTSPAARIENLEQPIRRALCARLSSHFDFINETLPHS